MLESVLSAAAARGIERFQAYVLTENYRMLRLLSTRTRIEERRTEDSVTRLGFRRLDADATAR